MTTSAPTTPVTLLKVHPDPEKRARRSEALQRAAEVHAGRNRSDGVILKTARQFEAYLEG